MLKLRQNFCPDSRCVLHKGDSFKFVEKIPDDYVSLTVSSPPYCMGKKYEASTDSADFVAAHNKLIPELVRITKPGGSICWQVGFHVKAGVLTPLDYLAWEIFSKFPELQLRNRIIWTFGHGLHCSKRFSGRHEVILWFTKGNNYTFDLDRVRIAQKYPGKTHYKGEKRGQPSANPNGKNPSDVWDIPVVNAGHPEKSIHPCQFPHALAQRLILALTNPDEIVFDPFAGSGTTGAAAIVEGRKFVGCEQDPTYWRVVKTRILQADRGTLKYRPHDRPVKVPDPNSAVANRPRHD